MRIDWDELLPPKPADKATDVPPTTDARPVETDAEIADREREGDNRRRCTECRNLGERGLCLAAYRGEIVASRNYTPVRDILRRCEGFGPLPTDPDQTLGRIKWAWLRDHLKPKDATL